MKRTLPYIILTMAAIVPAAFAADVDTSKLPPASAKQGVTYEKDIKPIFEDACFRCHGSEGRPRGGLRLDSLEGALKGSKDGKVIEPGDSAKSDLVIAVAKLDPKTAMPPKPRARRPRPPAGGDTNAAPTTPPPPPADLPKERTLTPEQVGLIRAWIDQGAK